MGASKSRPQNDGEKYLVLKKKFRGQGDGSSKQSSASPSLNDSRASLSTTPDVSLNRIELQSLAGDDGQDNASYRDAIEPPSYKPPPPPDSVSQHSSEDSVFYDCGEATPESPPDAVYHEEVDPPPVPPRRKSSDKIRQENKENEEVRRPRPITADPEAYDALVEDSKLSVKDCAKKFNKMALESNLNSKVLMPKKRADKGNAERDDDDSTSGTLLDAQSREWLIRCAQAKYHTIAKLASENPKLTRLKDPTNGYTALHWAAKHGNEDVIKLIAGTHGANVNARTNGGYTPLHIAMQFGHKKIYKLLIDVYNADCNLRDWSGKKPHQYLVSKEVSSSVETMRSELRRKRNNRRSPLKEHKYRIVTYRYP